MTAGDFPDELANFSMRGFANSQLNSLYERRSIDEMSAGQFQRALFARVILKNAPMALLGDPLNRLK